MEAVSYTHLDVYKRQEQGIKELFESEKYMRYLSVMSKFHRYSVNNTMLIYMQKPEATLVAGFNKWKNQFERHVKKGEHGITIIAPTPYKKTVSYTHLDVYKRQGLHRGGQFRRCLQDQELSFDLRMYQGLRPDELVTFYGGTH